MTTTTAATSTDATAPDKSHFVILDGLRGVAALMVVVFHLFEAYTFGDAQKQIINHGYLAVDFFFLLSGFVIAYAYDDRWGRMSQWDFYKRRLIRLQPMVVAGALIGALLFAFQDYSVFTKYGSATTASVLLTMLLGFIMVPLPKSADIRGWDEMYTLNAPAWSLLYEYLANILYAVVLRRLGVRWLALCAIAAAVALLHLATSGGRGDLVGGWVLDANGIRIGLTRVLFPFIAGILLMRLGARLRIRNGFAVSSLILITALSLPRFGGTERLWLNGLYDAGCVILLFPLIVAIGAGEKAARGRSLTIARFFGDLSFPLYITHYPLIYIYTGWVTDQKVPASQGAVVGVGVFIAAVAIAYGCLKWYDEPVRRWLGSRYLWNRR